MKYKSLKVLAGAIAAAAMLVGGVAAKAVSLEISAKQFVLNLGQYVQDGDIAAAKDALRQLADMGITQLKIGSSFYQVSDIIKMLDDPLQARSMFKLLLASLSGGAAAYFVAENRVISSVNWTDTTGDLFPTGSTG